MAVTPNMNLTLPSPTVTTGPEWASELNTAITTVDSHDHSPGKGTLVPTSGLNINDDLDMNANALLDTQRVALSSQASSLPVSNTNSVYAINGDLWYNNSSGTPVQITAGSSITSASSPLVPTGVIWPYGGTSAPTGFLLCNGLEVSRVTYAALFAVIGTIYGVGDGSTTFNLPFANGRAPIGAGTYTDSVSGSVTRTLGDTLGAEKHLNTSAESGVPAHTHSITDPGHAHLSINGSFLTSNVSGAIPYSGGGGGIGTNTGVTDIAGTGITGTNVNSTANAASAHNNMQPSFVTNFIIKT